MLPGVELSVSDGANGIHTLVVFSDEWLSDDGDFINQFLNVAFTGKTPEHYENANGICSLDLCSTIKTLEGYHKDFFISSPVRVFVFFDRVEIISPGHLPNNLTVENIKAGNSNRRNPILASYANHILPYRGYGSGIIRALEKYQHIDFIDDRDGNVFKVIFKRKTQ